jgi:hypothetical protein
VLFLTLFGSSDFVVPVLQRRAARELPTSPLWSCDRFIIEKSSAIRCSGPRAQISQHLRRHMLPKTLIALLVFCTAAYAQPTGRTVAPEGAVIVKASGAQTGEFQTIQAAVASLPADTSAQVIFVYPGILFPLEWRWNLSGTPGTYTEQVHLTRTGNLTVNSA